MHVGRENSEVAILRERAWHSRVLLLRITFGFSIIMPPKIQTMVRYVCPLRSAFVPCAQILSLIFVMFRTTSKSRARLIRTAPSLCARSLLPSSPQLLLPYSLAGMSAAVIAAEELAQT
jgi:hypothetical protein